MNLDTTRLTKCRENLGFSKQKTARLIGVSQPAYLRYESGERQPSIQVIKEIAKVLNTSVDYLIGASNKSTPDFIEINKKSDKTLFQIVEQCSNMDEKHQELLLEYIRELSKTT